MGASGERLHPRRQFSAKLNLALRRKGDQESADQDIKMTWNRWYAFRSYVRSSLWTVPFVVIVAEQLALRTVIALDTHLRWIPDWPFNDAGTSAVLQTIVTLTLSFLVFTFGSMLVALQVASGQLTPRIIATTLLRDNVIRGAVGLFIFTMLFAIGAVSRIGSPAGYLITWVSALLGLISVWRAQQKLYSYNQALPGQ